MFCNAHKLRKHTILETYTNAWEGGDVLQMELTVHNKQLEQRNLQKNMKKEFTVIIKTADPQQGGYKLQKRNTHASWNPITGSSSFSI